MGKFAEDDFGKSKFGSVGIIVAGTSNKEIEDEVLSFFDKKITFKDSVYHSYLAEKNGVNYPIIFNVYGAPVVIDALASMHDGGCKNVIFVGFAYGFRDVHVGDIVISTESHHFEGIYSIFDKKKAFSQGDKKLTAILKKIFDIDKIHYLEGKNISVPAVSFQLPHSNKFYKKIKPLTLEMELASFFARAKDLGIRAAGVLVISDTKEASIIDKSKKQIRHTSKIKVLNNVISNLKKFDLPELKEHKHFKLDMHLASIIEDGSGVNVYKK